MRVATREHPAAEGGTVPKCRIPRHLGIFTFYKNVLLNDKNRRSLQTLVTPPLQLDWRTCYVVGYFDSYGVGLNGVLNSYGTARLYWTLTL